MKKHVKQMKSNYLPIHSEFDSCIKLNPNGYVEPPVIHESIYDSISGDLLEKITLTHSVHSQKRAKCRGFSTEDIMSVIEFGKLIFKQGLCFYIALKRHLPEFLDSKTIERINNMVVVTNNYGNAIVTCYKSRNASSHLRKKSKELMKYSNCA